MQRERVCSLKVSICLFSRFYLFIFLRFSIPYAIAAAAAFPSSWDIAIDILMNMRHLLSSHIGASCCPLVLFAFSAPAHAFS